MTVVTLETSLLSKPMHIAHVAVMASVTIALQEYTLAFELVEVY